MNSLDFEIIFSGLVIFIAMIGGGILVMREDRKEYFFASGCLLFAILSLMVINFIHLEDEKDSANQWQEQKQLDQQQIQLLTQISNELKK